MTSTPLTPARALRPPRRIDARALFGIVLLLIATAGGIAFWSLSSNTRPVLVVTHDLPAGAALIPADLTVSRVRVDDALYYAAVPASDLGSLVGKQLAEPVHAQQMLGRAQLISRPPLQAGQVAMTIAVSPETAVGNRIHAGDAVQVLLTTNKGKPDSHTSILLPRVTVLDVGYADRTAVLSSSGTGRTAAEGPIHWITLITSQDQAVQLAQAKWNGDLDVALLPPKQP